MSVGRLPGYRVQGLRSVVCTIPLIASRRSWGKKHEIIQFVSRRLSLVVQDHLVPQVILLHPGKNPSDSTIWMETARQRVPRSCLCGIDRVVERGCCVHHSYSIMIFRGTTDELAEALFLIRHPSPELHRSAEVIARFSGGAKYCTNYFTDGNSSSKLVSIVEILELDRDTEPPLTITVLKYVVHEVLVSRPAGPNNPLFESWALGGISHVYLPRSRMTHSSTGRCGKRLRSSQSTRRCESCSGSRARPTEIKRILGASQLNNALGNIPVIAPAARRVVQRYSKRRL